jgi:hypothetical protein
VGNAILATDGVFGVIRDFAFDDTTWDLHHLVVKIRDGHPNKLAFIPQRVLREPDEGRCAVPVSLTLDEARQLARIKPGYKLGPHDRFASRVTGRPVATRDGPVGHVADCLVEDQPWVIRYLIVRLQDERFVLVPTAWIDSTRSGNNSMVLDATGKAVKEARTVDPAIFLFGVGSEALHDYCNRSFRPIRPEADRGKKATRPTAGKRRTASRR